MLTTWLMQEMNKKGWDTNELAQQSGLNTTTLEATFNGDRRPDFEFCFRVADVLEKQPERLLNMAGLLSDTALSHALRLSRADSMSRVVPNREVYNIRRELSLEERRLIIQCARRRGSKDPIYTLLQAAPHEFNSQERRQDRIRFALWVVLLVFIAIGGSILLGLILR